MRSIYYHLRTRSGYGASVGLVLMLSGCLAGPSFMKQSDDAKQVDGSDRVNAVVISAENGVVTGALTSDATSTQVLEAAGDSEIAGAAVAFPPGSLEINTDITIEQGASLASGALATELGLGAAALSAASNAVVITPRDEVDAIKPFTVAIGLSGASLLEQDTSRLIVIYRVKKAGSGYFSGVIPNSQLTIVGSSVKFETQFFGSFQVAYSEATINEAKEVTSTATVITKREEVALPDPLEVKITRSELTSLQVSWLNGGGAATYFVLAHRLDAAPPSCVDAQTKATDLAKTEAVIAGLSPGKTYGIRVCAVDQSGRMSAGIAITGKTLSTSSDSVLGAFSLPTPPTSAFRLELIYDFKIAWSQSTGATDYEVFFASDIGCKAPVGPKMVTTTTMIDADVANQPEGLFFLCVKARRGTAQRLVSNPMRADIDRTTIHVAYRKNVVDDTELHYARVLGKSANSQLIAAGTQAAETNIDGASDLAVSPNGETFISYRQFDPTSSTSLLKAIKIFPNGNSAPPSTVSSDTGFDHGYANAMVTAGDGSIDIVSSKTDISTLALQEHKGILGSFVNSPVRGLSPLVLNEVDLAVDATGTRHIAYAYNDAVFYTSASSASWNSALQLSNATALATYCNKAFGPSISVASNGRPVIAFICQDGVAPSTCRLVSAIGNTSNGFDFHVLSTVATSTMCYPEVGIQSLRPSLLRRPDGLMGIAFTERLLGSIYVGTLSSTGVLAAGKAVSGSSIRGGVSLAFDKRGRTYVTYMTTSSELNLVTNRFAPFETATNQIIPVGTGVTGLADLGVTGMPGRSDWTPLVPPSGGVLGN